MENKENKQVRQVERYFVWGIVTVIFNVYVFYVLHSQLHLDYQLANFIDWILTVLFAFVVNKFLVFKSENTNLLKELLGFFGTRLLTFLIEIVLLWLLISLFNANTTISKLIGHSVALVINYYLSKFLFLSKNDIKKHNP